MRTCLRAALIGVVVSMLGCGGGGGGSGGSSPPQTAVVNGSCSTTTVNQCRAGTFADTADSDAEHRWDCRGSGGGTTAMCSLPKPVDGECGAEVNMCRSGDLDDVGDSDADFLWNCDGRHGGQTAMCSLPRPVDGVCGAEVNVCLLGNLDDIDDSDADFLWNCDGRHGGSTAMCSIPKPIDGECGEEVNQCLIGNLDDIDDSDADFLWNCDGQHGGQPAACSLLKTVVCPNGAPASDNPLSCERGNTNFMIPGIDRLPLDRVLLTNEQVQRHFAIVDIDSVHAEVVGVTACESYVTASEGCRQHKNRARVTRHPEGDEGTRTGLTPFTQILDLAHAHYSDSWKDEQIDAMQDLRILNLSLSTIQFLEGYSNKPHLQVRSAGNGRNNHSWFLEGYHSSEVRDLFIRAIAANKMLFAAGVARNVHGEYIRHSGSSSCKNVDYGCFWTWFRFLDWGPPVFAVSGTSASAPNVAASLASILSIFPDTEHQDLAKLARACAKKTGEGIDGPHGLLATSGGFGVADFSCMDEIVAVSADLSANETAILAIDGREVTVGRRAIAVAEAEAPARESVDYHPLVALYDATDGPELAGQRRMADRRAIPAMARGHGR